MKEITTLSGIFQGGLLPGAAQVGRQSVDISTMRDDMTGWAEAIMQDDRHDNFKRDDRPYKP